MTPEQKQKWFTGIIVTVLIIATIMVIVFIAQAQKNITESQTVQTQTTSTTTTPETNTESAVTFLKEIVVTPDETFLYGAFCRVNYVEETDDFFVSFGGSSPIVPFDPEKGQYRAGGAEGGNGYSYKKYTKDFEYKDESGALSNTGGDAASVMAEGYYFILTGGQKGWQINKIDPTTWETVATVDIDIDATREATNDQMLAYSNGILIASSLWAGDNAEGLLDQRKTDPNQGTGTHNHTFTTDLEPLDYFILDDTPHINGSYVVYVDGIYNYITSTAYFGKIIIMQYDKDWNYIGTKTTEEYGQWAQGAVYDPATEKFYVAYIDLGEIINGKISPESSPNIALGIFDKDWNLLENVAVTTYNTREDNTATGRPSVIMQDGKLYVSYDVETFVPETHEENKDWGCTVKMYEIES